MKIAAYLVIAIALVVALWTIIHGFHLTQDRM